MTSIREAGKINKNTTLIDFGMSVAAGSGSVYLVERLLSETGLVYHDVELIDPKLKYGLKMLNATRRIRRKKPLLAVENFTYDTVIPWLTSGYKISTGTEKL
ncbi:MAG: hypothetical protein ACW98U_14750 [Candidatus Thorarchaeota archaeon]